MKKIISLITVLSVATSLFTAVPGWAEENVISPELTELMSEDSSMIPENINEDFESEYDVTILACTDFQNPNGSNAGAEIVEGILSSIKDYGADSADAFFCCGDYAGTYGETEENLDILKSAVIDFVPDEDSHVYVQGNHDADIGTQGLAQSGNNDPANGEYGVYVINEDDYMWGNSDKVRIWETSVALAEYLGEKIKSGYDKPIFVLSHLPLYKSQRTTNDGDAKHANYLFHVLNQAGAQGLNIIFMAGHDHSSAYESYLGGSAVYLAKGDTINIPQGNKWLYKTETLNFTYMNAGYVGYYATGANRDSTLTMTYFGIKDDTVDVFRFDSEGLHNLKSPGILKSGEVEKEDYEADTRVYTSPQTIALTEANGSGEIETLKEPISAVPDFTAGEFGSPIGAYFWQENGNARSYATYGVTAKEKHSGNYSWKLTNSYTTDSYCGGTAAKLPLISKAEIGKKYRISWWERNDRTIGNFSWVVEYSGGSQMIAWDPEETYGEWNYQTFDLTAEGAWHDFQVQFKNGGTCYYIDDIEIREINEDGSLGENIVFNGDIEKVVDYTAGEYGSPIDAYYWQENNNARNYATYGATATDKHSGKYSWKLTNSYTADTWCGGTAAKLLLKSKAETGKTYRISWWERNDRKIANFTWNVEYSGGSQMLAWDPESTNGEWIQRTYDLEAKGPWHDFQVNFKNGGTCYYIDDIEVREIKADGTLGENLVVNGDIENVNDDFGDETVPGQEDLVALMSGYTYIKGDEDGYVDVETFNAEQKAYFYSKSKDWYGQFVDREHTQISFTTDSKEISFEYKIEEAYGYVDIFVDNKLEEIISAKSLSDEGEISFNLDGKEHRVDIYLPRGGLLVRNLSGLPGSSIEPVKGRTKALFYGDSITYGYLLDHSTDCYVSQLQRKMDYEVVNFGVGGYYYDGGQVISQNKFEPDIIFVAYGANDVQFSMNDVKANAKAFFSNLRDLYPTQKVYVITPTFANDNQSRIQYLDDVRAVIKEVCAGYSNFTVIDGLKMIPSSNSYFVDGVHPNVTGNTIYANNLAAALGQGSAEKKNGWQITYHGTENTNRETHVAELSNEYRYSGDTSMLIKYPGSKIDGNCVEIKGQMYGKMESGDYTLKFYSRGKRSSLTEIQIGDDIVIGYADTNPTKVTNAPSGEGSWYECVYNFSYTAQDEDFIIFRYNGDTGTTAIDDVTITPADGGDNIVFDSSFEGEEFPGEDEEEDDKEKEFDTTDYQAKQMLASAADGRIGLSWINPMSPDLEKISLYNVTDGEKVLITDEFTVTPGTMVNYPVPDLSNGVNYKFEIVFEFKDKAPFTYYMSATPTGADTTSMGVWTMAKRAWNTSGYCPLETIIVKDGNENQYLKITSNVDGKNVPGLNGNTYMDLYQSVTLKPNTTYIIKYRAKSENFGGMTVLYDWNGYLNSGVSGTRGWDDYSLTFTTGDAGAGSIRFLVEQTGIICLDDIELYEMIDNVATGENLVREGGFEEAIFTEQAVFSEVYADDIKTDGLTIFWGNESSNVKKVKLYVEKFGNYEYRGTLDAKSQNVTISDLELGTEYSYMLVPVNQYGYDGEAEVIFAETALPDYVISQPKIYKGNSQTSKLSQGKHRAEVTVKNYKLDSMPVAFAVAVYKNGAIEKLYVTETEVDKQTKDDAGVKLKTEFEVGGTGGYSAEVFLLDTMEELNSYYPCVVYN